MSLIQILRKELDQEAPVTRKMLSLVPLEKFDWKPHEKSMTVKRLATHIAELPDWINMAINTDEIDFKDKPYELPDVKNTEELLAFFDSSLQHAREALDVAKDESLSEDWTMRVGDRIVSTRSRAEVIRMSLNQVVHHRAQLGVFFRLLDIPLPGTYGPSADEPAF
ncbi:DinB family protein [Chitinophaga pendula]|uniref:DinB family protein n=1 Tax=Chitinophaga TaxID=79328 RepID=UPI000BAE7F8B|nr:MULTISPECIES: DinB family protein [Chitinophaga]ASZ12333.1 damage-inducible protein DinB [Chitinophaga sp. MD30]UCJ10073.1 DinB family protein [Chitinophaga pendula]